MITEKEEDLRDEFHCFISAFIRSGNDDVSLIVNTLFRRIKLSKIEVKDLEPEHDRYAREEFSKYREEMIKKINKYPMP